LKLPNPLDGLRDLADGVRQLGSLLDPKLLSRLRDAGAFDPRTTLGAIGTLPWILGRGPSLGILTQIHATARGGETALIDRDGSLTWAELDARANRLAHALEAMELGKGDRVATLLRNGRESIEAMIACQKLGLEVAPLNTWAKPKELRTILERSEPAILIYDPKHEEQVREALGEEPSEQGCFDYESLIAEQPPSQPSPIGARGGGRILIHTSGTTGKPKAASRSASGKAAFAFLQVLAVVPYRQDDVIVCPAPLFHSFGLLTMTIWAAVGATIVLPEKFDPDDTLELVEASQATALSLVPVMIRRILSLSEQDRQHDLSSLRLLLASGSAMGPDLRKKTMELFGDVLYDLYGSTEAGWVAIATPEDIRAEPETLGKPVPGVDVAVFSEDKQRLDTGESGTLYIKSDLVFEGYASGEDTEEIDGYLSIGDMGHLDDEGRLFVEGRGDDMVVVGGENVYPAEIEEVIDGIEGVEDVAVAGIKDEEYGEVLAAFVQGSVDPDQVKQVCKQELASFKVPKVVEIVDDMPRTSTGKIKKQELIEEHQEQQSA
jgi:acyl-CoA synthetase (AMP-forming)/AMP-acid ligase II